MTKVNFASGGLTLEGRFASGSAGPVRERGAAGVVICHPHPRFGGSMDNNVVYALEEHWGGRGLATLCFNFRGAGKSEGEWDDMRGEVDDVISALSFLAKRPEVDAERIGLAGYSFGGLMAVKAVSRIEKNIKAREREKKNGDNFRVKALALISPMPPAKGWEAEKELAPFYDNPSPTLIVAGTADRFCPVKSAQDLSIQIGPEARLVIVEGADHFFIGKEDEISAHAAGFMERLIRP